MHYHYWNPHGDIYAGRPANQEEALQRREERWLEAKQLEGRSPDIKKAKLAPEYSYTLDLRRQLSA